MSNLIEIDLLILDSNGIAIKKINVRTTTEYEIDTQIDKLVKEKY